MNNILSQRLTDMEGNIQTTEKHLRERMVEDVGLFVQRIITSYETQNNTTNINDSNSYNYHNINITEEWSTKLKEEAKSLTYKLQKKPYNASDTECWKGSTLTIRNQQLLDEVSQKLSESVNHELQDSRRLIESQRNQINQLENEKVKLVCYEANLSEGNEDEFTECVVYLKSILLQKKSSLLDNTMAITSSQRNLHTLKKMMDNLNDTINSLYDKSSKKSGDISDLTETISYLTQQLKSRTVRTECLEDENDVLRKKSEQTELSVQHNMQELNVMQNRLKQLQEERHLFMEGHIQEEEEGDLDTLYQPNGNKKKLLEKIKELEDERDCLVSDLHEQMKQTTHYDRMSTDLEQKCATYQEDFDKLQKEHDDLVQEMQVLAMENERNKNCVVESDRQRDALRRDLKALEMSNNDLSDQLFFLSNENSTMREEHDRIRSTLVDYNTVVYDLQDKITKCEVDILVIDKDLQSERSEKQELEESNKHLISQLTIKDELETVLTDARSSMLQELEEKIRRCEKGIRGFEADIQNVKTEKQLLEATNKHLRIQVDAKKKVNVVGDADSYVSEEKESTRKKSVPTSWDAKLHESRPSAKDLPLDLYRFHSLFPCIYEKLQVRSNTLTHLKPSLEKVEQHLTDLNSYIQQQETELLGNVGVQSSGKGFDKLSRKIKPHTNIETLVDGLCKSLQEDLSKDRISQTISIASELVDKNNQLIAMVTKIRQNIDSSYLRINLSDKECPPEIPHLIIENKNDSDIRETASIANKDVDNKLNGNKRQSGASSPQKTRIQGLKSLFEKTLAEIEDYGTCPDEPLLTSERPLKGLSIDLLRNICNRYQSIISIINLDDELEGREPSSSFFDVQTSVDLLEQDRLSLISTTLRSLTTYLSTLHQCSSYESVLLKDLFDVMITVLNHVANEEAGQHAEEEQPSPRCDDVSTQTCHTDICQGDDNNMNVTMKRRRHSKNTMKTVRRLKRKLKEQKTIENIRKYKELTRKLKNSRNQEKRISNEETPKNTVIEETISKEEEEKLCTVDRLKRINTRFGQMVGKLKLNQEMREEIEQNCICSGLLNELRTSIGIDGDIIHRTIQLLSAISHTDTAKKPSSEHINSLADESTKIVALLKMIDENKEKILMDNDQPEDMTESKDEESKTDCCQWSNASSEEHVANYLMKRFSNSKESFASESDQDPHMSMLLKRAQKRIRHLSDYLKRRERDFKEPGEQVTGLDDLLTIDTDMKGESREEKISSFYSTIKTRLEEDSKVVQMIVKEVSEDLSGLQKDYEDMDISKEQQYMTSSLRSENTTIDESCDNLDGISLEEQDNSLHCMTSDNEKCRSLSESVNLHKKAAFETKDISNTLNWQVLLKDGFSEKKSILLNGYEILLAKLLQQRSEIMSIIGIDESDKLYNLLSAGMALGFDTNDNIREQSHKIDTTYNMIANFLLTFAHNWKHLGRCFEELCYFLATFERGEDKDSSYSTDSNASTDGEEACEGEEKNSESSHMWNVFQDLQRDESVCSENQMNQSNMYKVVEKIKELANHLTYTNNHMKKLKRKGKRSRRTIRMLLKEQRNAKQRNTRRLRRLSRKLKKLKTQDTKTPSLTTANDTKCNANMPLDRTDVLRSTSKELGKDFSTQASSAAKAPSPLTPFSPHTHSKNDENQTPKTSISSTTSNEKKMSTSLISNEMVQRSFLEFNNKRIAMQNEREYILEYLNITTNCLCTTMGISNQTKNTNVQNNDNVNNNDDNNKNNIINNNNNNNNNNNLDNSNDLCDSTNKAPMCREQLLHKTLTHESFNVKDLQDIDEIKNFDPSHLEMLAQIIRINRTIEYAVKQKQNSLQIPNEEKSDPFPNEYQSKISSGDPGKDSVEPSQGENHLQTILDCMKQRVDDLSGYLKDREDDIKEREQVFKKIKVEMEETTKGKEDSTNVPCKRCEKLLSEYSNSKMMLEDENEFLQLSLLELCEEISNLETGLKDEQEVRNNLRNIIKTMEERKTTFRLSDSTNRTDDGGISKSDEGYVSKCNTDANNDSSMSTSESPSTTSPLPTLKKQTRTRKRHSYEDQGFWDTGFSDDSVPVYSDDDPLSLISPISPFSPSHINDNFEIISDSMNNCSKIAYKIKTVAATEKIKSKNHPLSFLDKEITTLRPSTIQTLSESESGSSQLCDSLGRRNPSPVKNSSPFSRVLGRRANQKQTNDSSCGSRGYALSNNNNNGRHGNFNDNTYYSTLPCHYETYFLDSGDDSPPQTFTQTLACEPKHSKHSTSTSVNNPGSTSPGNDLDEEGVAPFLSRSVDSCRKRKKKKFTLFGRKRET